MINCYYSFLDCTCTISGARITETDGCLVASVGATVTSNDDIITCYLKYGDEVTRHLFGEASFFLYDKNNKRLLVVRDKLGVSTIYFAQCPLGIFFSTGLKEILPQIPHPLIRPHEFAQPIRHNYPIDLERTWIEQVFRIKAGECFIVEKDGFKRLSYFSRNHEPTFSGSKQDAIAESLRLMRKSVKQCVSSSSGPVAVMLSGGIDSTSLASFVKEIQGEVHVFSAGYKGNKYVACDERPVARRFAKEIGATFHDVELDVQAFSSYLDNLIPFIDEPCFDINCMVQYAVYKEAAEMGFKTILSGLGGDELFYSYVWAHKLIQASQRRQRFISLYPASKKFMKVLCYAMHNLKTLLWPTDSAILSDMNPTMWTYSDYSEFAKNATLNFGAQSIVFSDIDVSHHFPDNVSVDFLYDYIFSTFANTLCVYMGNKLAAANGISICYPLLNPELVSFLDSLPLEVKFDISQPKRFQKEIMAGILPEYILNSKKRGFEPPFEFIKELCKNYKYKSITADYVFFNSMVADKITSYLFR